MRFSVAEKYLVSFFRIWNINFLGTKLNGKIGWIYFTLHGDDFCARVCAFEKYLSHINFVTISLKIFDILFLVFPNWKIENWWIYELIKVNFIGFSRSTAVAMNSEIVRDFPVINFSHFTPSSSRDNLIDSFKVSPETTIHAT